MLLLEHGAVSAPVAEAMAEGIRKRARTDFGLSVTGIAGPGGGSEEKPVGLVYIALADDAHTEHRKLHHSRRSPTGSLARVASGAGSVAKKIDLKRGAESNILRRR